MKWNFDGKRLASGTTAGTIGVWWEDAIDNQLRLHFTDHQPGLAVRCFSWRSNSQILASCANDCEIHIRDVKSNILILKIRAEQPFIGLAFDNSGQYLTTKSFDDKIQIWRINLHNLSYQLIYEIEESCCLNLSHLSQNPAKNIVATVDQAATWVNLWNIDFDLINCQHKWSGFPYQADKVMLLGESNVVRKKTIQAFLALPDCNIRGENRLSLGETEIKPRMGNSKIVEVILWNELQDFSFSNFDNVRIKDASLIIYAIDIKKLADRNTQVLNAHPSVALAENLNIPVLYLIIDESGFHDYLQAEILAWLKEMGIKNSQWLNLLDFSMVAKTHEMIYQLVSLNSDNVVDTYSFYNAVEAFYDIKKENGELIHSLENSYQQFFNNSISFSSQNISIDDFRKCLTNFELSGKIYYFALNDTIFLEPSLTYIYVNAMSKAASEDPLDMGRLDESRLNHMDIPMHQDCRVKDRQQEQLLVMAITSMLESSNLIYKVSTGNGSYWVFPSELQKETTLSENSLVCDTEFTLEGKLKDAYSFIVTRLVGSTLFSDPQLWKNLALFKSISGENCALEYISSEIGKGQFNLAYGHGTSMPTRQNFSSFIRAQLNHAPSILSYKEIEQEFIDAVIEDSPLDQVFICYNSLDINYIQRIVAKLKRNKISVWYDRDLRAGDSILAEIDRRITASSTILILLGEHGLGQWQEREYLAIVKRAVEKGGRVIPGLLHNFNDAEGLPFFLDSYKYVDFRVFDLDDAINEIVRAVSNTEVHVQLEPA